MPKGEVFIKKHDGITAKAGAAYKYDEKNGFVQDKNGEWIDTFTQWGVSFTESSLSAMAAPAPNKQPVENKSRIEHGKRVITNTKYVRKDERDITLEMHIVATTKTQFWENYNRFCEEVLDYGFLEIRHSHTPLKVFRLTYESCSQFSEFMEELAKFALRLNEPDPTNRNV